MGPDTLSRHGDKYQSMLDKYQSMLRNISQELRQEMETQNVMHLMVSRISSIRTASNFMTDNSLHLSVSFQSTWGKSVLWGTRSSLPTKQCTRVFFSQQIKSFRTIAAYGRLELVIQFTQHLCQHHCFNIAIFCQICNYSSLKSHNVPVHNTTVKGPKFTTRITYGNVHQNIQFVSLDSPSTAQTELWRGCLWNMSRYL
jgi:hypothetical protein